jgi:hypothetical protein
MPRQVIRQLDRLVGQWRVQTRFEDDVVRWSMSVRWAQGDSCLLWQAKGTRVVSGEPFQSSGVIGFDHQRRRLSESSFSSDGASFTSRFDLSDPKKWKSPVEALEKTSDGKLAKATYVRLFSWKSPDEFSVQSTDRVVGGEPQPARVSNFRRVLSTAKNGSALPDAVAAHLRKLVGEWSVQVSIENVAYEGTIVYGLAPGTGCLIAHSRMPSWRENQKGRRPTVADTAVIGWDAKAKMLKEVGFDSQGGNFTFLYSLPVKNAQSGNGSGVTNGKSWTGRLYVRWKSDDEFLWRARNLTLKGETLPSVDARFIRK